MMHASCDKLPITLFKSITVGLTIFYRTFPTFNLNVRIFHGILPASQNIIMDLNNVMDANPINSTYQTIPVSQSLLEKPVLSPRLHVPCLY